MTALVWPSGVGGAQCEDCGETTVVRNYGTWEDGDQWLCRECVEGDEPDDAGVAALTLAGVLTLGETYEVERIDVHTWHTKVFLVGVDSGRGFNSVSFDIGAAAVSGEHPNDDKTQR